MPHMDITNYNLGEPPSVFLRTKRKMGRRTKRMLCRDPNRNMGSSDQSFSRKSKKSMQNTNRTIGSSDQSLSLGMKSKQITKRGRKISKKVSIA